MTGQFSSRAIVRLCNFISRMQRCSGGVCSAGWDLWSLFMPPRVPWRGSGFKCYCGHETWECLERWWVEVLLRTRVPSAKSPLAFSTFAWRRSIVEPLFEKQCIASFTVFTVHNVYIAVCPVHCDHFTLSCRVTLQLCLFFQCNGSGPKRETWFATFPAWGEWERVGEKL